MTGRTTPLPVRELAGAAENLRHELPPYFARRARAVHEEGSFVAICDDAHDDGAACDGCHMIEVVHPVLAELIAGLLNAREPLAAWLDDTALNHATEVGDVECRDCGEAGRCNHPDEAVFCLQCEDPDPCGCIASALAAARALLGRDGGESR